jgi:hypothetical protein
VTETTVAGQIKLGLMSSTLSNFIPTLNGFMKPFTPLKNNSSGANSEFVSSKYFSHENFLK